MPDLQGTVQEATRQVGQNHSDVALQTVERFLSESLMAHPGDLNHANQLNRQMSDALAQAGILPQIMQTAINPQLLQRIDRNNTPTQLETGEAQAIAGNQNNWGQVTPGQLMSLQWLASHMGEVTQGLGRPAGSVTIADLQAWTRRATERQQEIAGANNILQHPERNGGNTTGAAHESFMRHVSDAQRILRESGQLQGIENGKPGKMPDLIAEYARTHFSALSGNTDRITPESLQNYITNTAGLTPFARGILTQMQQRWTEISTASGDAPGTVWGRGSVTLQGLETYRSNAQTAGEAVDYLSTPAGMRFFAGVDTNGATNTNIHRDNVQTAMQNIAAMQAGPEKDRLQRIGQYLLTEIGQNRWYNSVSMANVRDYARTQGFRPNDQGPAFTPPAQPAEVQAPVQPAQPVQPFQPAQPGQPFQPAQPGQPPNDCQPGPNPANPLEQFGQGQRPAWALPGSNTPERQLMNQTIALLCQPGAFTDGSPNIQALTRLLNSHPETMERILPEVNRELAAAHVNHRLSWSTNYNPDGSQARLLSVQQVTDANGSTRLEGTAMSGQLQNRAPELTPWQTRVRDQLQGPNAFVVPPGASVEASNQAFQAACARAQQQGTRVTVVFGNERNPELVAAARAATQNGQVVLYADIANIPAGSQMEQYYRGATTPNADFPYGWVSANGGAISMEAGLNTNGTHTYYESTLGRPAAAAAATPRPEAAVNPQVYGPGGPNSMIYTSDGRQMTRQQYHQAMTAAGWQVVGYDGSANPIYQQGSPQTSFGYNGAQPSYYQAQPSYYQPQRRGLLGRWR